MSDPTVEEIIEQALTDIGELGVQEGLSVGEVVEATSRLNELIQEWESEEL